MQHSKTRGGRQGPVGKLKTSRANNDNASARSSGTRSPKAVDQRLQRAPTLEFIKYFWYTNHVKLLTKTAEKRVGKVSELETQLAELQEELKKSKEQLNESETCKKRAHQQAEEAKKHLSAMSAKLQESQQQLDELWACEESRIQELRKISQDRDRAWESELKAVQKHHSMDTATLAAVMNENQKLKIQLQKIGEAEASRAEEELKLRLELSETLELVEELRIELKESKDSEARALELVGRTREELETVRSRDVAGGLPEEESASAANANAEMESELRRLKVQTEQWRKAAEVATAMVLGNGGGDGSIDFLQSNSSPYSEDTEDESSGKKTSNMLKKIGVLLKKGQK